MPSCNVTVRIGMFMSIAPLAAMYPMAPQ